MSFPNPDGKIVAVIGSKTFNDKKLLYDFLTPRRGKIKMIILGGAAGADSLVVEWAKEFYIPYLVFPAAWHDKETGLLDKGAGFKRNWHIVDSSDMVLAFMQKGGSKGTRHSLDIAKSLGKPVQIIEFEPVDTL